MAVDAPAREKTRFLRIAVALTCVVAAFMVGRLSDSESAGQTAVVWVIVLSLLTVVVNALLVMVARARNPR